MLCSQQAAAVKARHLEAQQLPLPAPLPMSLLAWLCQLCQGGMVVAVVPRNLQIACGVLQFACWHAWPGCWSNPQGFGKCAWIASEGPGQSCSSSGPVWTDLYIALYRECGTRHEYPFHYLCCVYLNSASLAAKFSDRLRGGRLARPSVPGEASLPILRLGNTATMPTLTEW